MSAPPPPVLDPQGGRSVCAPGVAEHHMNECIRVMKVRSLGRAGASAELRPSVTLRAGVTIDERYHLVELLGRGGMGVVWKAHDVRLRRLVALKVASLSSEGERERFIREARICSRIRHRNIVEIFDVGVLEDGTRYYTMELVEGRDLGTVLREEQVGISVAVSILRQVAAALARVHHAGVVHRDVKPANIMINESPLRSTGGALCKLVDFGLAADAHATDEEPSELDAAHVTRSGQFMGTPLYMSPEQTRGESLDPRSDIYGFGCLAYELLTGSPPFRADDLPSLMHQHLHATPRPPSETMTAQASHETREALDALIGRCLAKRPEDRPATIGEVRAALGAIRFRPATRRPAA